MYVLWNYNCNLIVLKLMYTIPELDLSTEHIDIAIDISFTVTGLSLELSIVCIGVVCTFYTALVSN